MLPLTTVLCPTDFSDPSYVALRAAVELCQHFSAELVLVHAVTPIPMLPEPMVSGALDVVAYHRELAAAGLEALQLAAKDRVPEGVRLKLLVAQGEPAQEIVRLAGETRADLVVIATHGRTGWRALITGSVAEKVVRTAACPVLTIRKSGA